MKTFRVRLLRIWLLARWRDEGFLQSAFMQSRLDGDVLVFEKHDYLNLIAAWPARKEFQGLGDVIKESKQSKRPNEQVPASCC